MNIFLVCPMEDGQSGLFLHDTFVKLGHKVAYFDWRKITNDNGIEYMNNELINATEQLKPDLTLIIKGLGINGETIKRMRQKHEHNIFGWIFDVTLGGTFIKDSPRYIDMIKELDLFYTIDNDALPELKEKGVNAKWLTQASYPALYGEQILNNFQKRKYGADVVFIGSVGSIHPQREKFLKRIADEGINFKIYGEVLYPENKEPDWVKDHHTGYAAINEMHSTVCNSSKIVLGLDGWPERSLSHSMRLYKVMGAGAFYLTTHTKDIEQMFTPGTHLETFKDEDEMINKIFKYLMDKTEQRKIIAKQGQELVLEKHTFYKRIQELINETFKYKKKHTN